MTKFPRIHLHLRMIAIALVVLFLVILVPVYLTSSNRATAQDEGGAIRKPDLKFQMLTENRLGLNLHRSKIPGGWLLATRPSYSQQSPALVFVPDPDHTWDGKSLD